ncbi:P-loop NTPase fold protein [Stenomitos frigidus]|uniref:AAA family ATPase n=1 Tax=Stenomitos frigidus ULC18 TaxID=2107698 RepID=A0A2T1E5V4_9CYAN|nr:P-loop NTPase fold protein [Stenomitos frigidus]PSB28100.1 AAA family ATPase [Stenomitos frigidus ULC18]
MAEPLLTAFQTAYRNLELGPLLDPESLARFHVDYSEDILDQLVQLIVDSDTADSKVVFSGHRGCGKSTLLSALSRSPELADRYVVVMFSIADTVENSDIDHVNILFAIAVKLMLAAETSQIPIPKSTQAVIHRWLAEQTQTDVKELKGEASVNVNLLEVIQLKLLTNAGTRKEIKQKFERNASELVAQLNIIAAALRTAAKKETILVIIDDLDKLDLAVVKPIFKDNIKALCLPAFHIIYTIPIAALRDKEILPMVESEMNNRIVNMPVLKLLPQAEAHNPHAKPKPEVLDLLCAILHKRIPDQLLDRAVAETLIFYSGGVLRELIRIATESCRRCLLQIRREPTRQAITIDEKVLDEAVNKLRNDFALRLGKLDYAILQQVYTEFLPDDPTQKEFLDLLHGLHVLEYRNRKVWYDVHPIVVELLSDRDLI